MRFLLFLAVLAKANVRKKGKNEMMLVKENSGFRDLTFARP